MNLKQLPREKKIDSWTTISADKFINEKIIADIIYIYEQFQTWIANFVGAGLRMAPNFGMLEYS